MVPLHRLYIQYVQCSKTLPKKDWDWVYTLNRFQLVSQTSCVCTQMLQYCPRMVPQSDEWSFPLSCCLKSLSTCNAYILRGSWDHITAAMYFIYHINSAKVHKYRISIDQLILTGTILVTNVPSAFIYFLSTCLIIMCERVVGSSCSPCWNYLWMYVTPILPGASNVG